MYKIKGYKEKKKGGWKTIKGSNINKRFVNSRY